MTDTCIAKGRLDRLQNASSGCDPFCYDLGLYRPITREPGVTWHRLLAELPDDAGVKSQPVVPPALAGDPVVSPIAGWRQVTCEMSAGAAGLRHVMVVLDATGRPISAGDHVLTCKPVQGDSTLTRFEHESLGGRIEEDGTFNGTHWLMVYERPEESDAEDYEPIESHNRKPTDDETSALKSIVSRVLAKTQDPRIP